MKLKHSFLLPAAMTAVFLYGTSCNKKDAAAPPVEQEQALAKNLTAMRIEDKEAYVRTLLMDLARYVVTAAEADDASRREVYTELERNIDGDDNALIDEFYKKIPALEQDKNFHKALAAFADLEGHRYFPQVYIYNYDELKNAQKIAADNKITVAFAVTDGNNTKTIEGYQLNEAGDWETTGALTEAIAAEQEAWIFSLNETFTDRIDLSILPDYTKREPDQGAPNGLDHIGNKPTAYYWPYFEQIRLHNFKESWFWGKAEVNCLTYSFWDNPGNINPVTGIAKEILWRHKADANMRVCKFPRKNNYDMTVNFGYMGSWEPQSDFIHGWPGDAFLYVLYEEDSYPTGERQTTVSYGTLTTNYLRYRSRDGFFDKGVILYWGPPGTHMGDYIRENEDIRFNSRM